MPPPGLTLAALHAQFEALDEHVRGLAMQLAQYGSTLSQFHQHMEVSGAGASPPHPLERNLARIHFQNGTGAPWCRLGLLGPVVVACGERPVVLRRRGKSESILKALALTRNRRVPSALLAEWIWPDLNAQDGRHNLQTTVSAMRRTFEQVHGPMEVLHSRGDAYELNADVVTDVEQFDLAYENALALEQRGLADVALSALISMVPLYRDDLDIDEFAELKFLIERERLSAIYLQVLSKIGAMFFQRGAWEECIAYASRLLARDPGREDAHRLIIRSYACLGQRAQGLHQFQLCVRIIRQHLDADVEPETRSLLAELLG